MFEAIASILGGGGLGAIVGTIGSIWKGISEAKQKKEEMDHEYRMTELSIKDSAQQFAHEKDMADKQIQRAKTEGEIRQDIADTQVFGQSVLSGLKSTGIKFVDAVRGLMRPIITVYMLGIATYISINISYLVGGFDSFNPDELLALYKQIIGDIMFLTMTAVTWWFGSRPTRKQ